jgi:hypothetical protein
MWSILQGLSIQHIAACWPVVIQNRRKRPLGERSAAADKLAGIFSSQLLYFLICGAKLVLRIRLWEPKYVPTVD